MTNIFHENRGDLAMANGINRNTSDGVQQDIMSQFLKVEI